MEIQIKVGNRVANNMTPAEVIVCGNSGYKVVFDFDEEWSGQEFKTARFVYRKNGEDMYDEVAFAGDTVDVPILSDINYVKVGVYAGDLETTTPAVILCKKSILCGFGGHEEPDPDVYNMLVNLLNTEGIGALLALKQDTLGWITDDDITAMFHGLYADGDEDDDYSAFLEMQEKAEEAAERAEEAAKRAADSAATAGEEAEYAGIVTEENKNAAINARHYAEEAAARAEAAADDVLAAQEKSYELIEKFTVETGTAYERTQEPDGTPYRFKKILIKEATAAARQFSFSHHFYSNDTLVGFSSLIFAQDTNKRHGAMEVYQDSGYWRSVSYTPYDGELLYDSTRFGGTAYTNKYATADYPYITKVAAPGAVPSPIEVEIWGVRA